MTECFLDSNNRMSLKVIVHSASNLPNVDFRGLSDPFVVLSFRGCKKSTSVQKDTLNPEWEAKDATCEWSLGAGHLQQDDKLSIKVKDYELAWFQKLLGQVEIPLHELRKSGKEIKKQNYELEDGKHRPTIGTVCLDIEYVPPGGRDGKGEEQIDGDETDVDGDHYDDESQKDEDEHDHDRGEEKRSTRVKNRMPRRRTAREWSDKIKDFQIRIHIFEGRQLPGANIQPMVRVTVAGQRKQTSTKQSTNNPIYNDEMLSFNFRKSEAELFDEPIILEVFNARGLFRSNALLGFFKFDIGFVHERKGHSFIRKWIMLSKPAGKKEKESFHLGTKDSPAGYLKVTAVVQGSGDKLPVGIDVPTVEDKDEDIEANCLTPVGLHRQSAVFVLNVYQANDLPQMDAGILTKFKRIFTGLSLWSKRSEEIPQAKEDLEEEQNLVDPYLIFSFGGNQVSTDIEYKNSNPKFRQALKIPFLFPSMCERLKLQLKDWDQGKKNDFIGTAYLHLSAISGQGGLGEGFLPQFGPSYVNFYGSPREYHKTTDKLEHLNKGIGEGVAYRGRLLVELKTIQAQGTSRPTRNAMAAKDEINVEPFKKCSKFTLFACFHEATMIAMTDGSVEFEISMGNKGTKFDESVAPSNTTPCKPVYDHSYYHYLPWGKEKPCVWIECSWEDISFRIEPLNILTNMWKKLKSDLEELQKGEKRMNSVLEGFSETCRMELIRFRKETIKFKGRSQRNPLDKELHDLRKTELENLMTEAKSLSEKPEDELKMENVIEEIKKYIKRIRSMAKEPQLSMPDVILWMISDNKRVAYRRIPAHQVLFSDNEAACGKFCGKTIELRFKYPGRDAEETYLEIPVLVRLELWLGLAKQQQHWINRENREFNVYAETYENEMRKKSTWSPSTSRTWPHYSDVSGSLELPKNSFTAPEGWKFSGDWMKSSGDLTKTRQLEENLMEFLDEVYEHEARKIPGGDWKPDSPRYVDSYGEETTLTPDPPKGWIKTTDWSVDLNCAVDDKGWQYTKHRSYYEYGPEEKAFDMSRRRRLIRPRRRDLKAKVKQVHDDPKLTDGWEYAQSFHERFHPDERKRDCLRRRRWLHKIVPEAAKKGSSIKFPVFKVLVQGLLGKESALCVIPRMLMTYPITKCQLWVSVYQARGLIVQDNTGMNDPYVRVTFSYQSQVTEILNQTLSPIWDQTLIFNEVDIFDNPNDLVKDPPSVVMEIFDYDEAVHDFLGRCIFKPKVRIEGNDGPKLAWRKLRRGDQDAGQILAECELFLIEKSQLPALPKPRGRVYPVRPEVAPEMQRKAIEILSWGVRNIKGNNLPFGPNISVEFECNQEVLKSNEVIKDVARCPNFSRPVLERKVLELPANDEYAPPINIRVFNSKFGKSPIGLHEIQSLKEFEVHAAESQSHADDIEGLSTEGKKKKSAESDQGKAAFETQEAFDWWSKYDASRVEEANTAEDKERVLSSRDKRKHEDPMTHVKKYLARGYDTLKFYRCKLEDVPRFKGFNDFVTTFTLRKGKTKSNKDSETEIGQFKGAFRILNDPDSRDNTMATMHLRPSKPIDCVVRVYVIRANHLQPKDADGLADPYLIVSLGDTKYDRKDERIPKTLNPIFGSVFKFKAKIPIVKDLKIQVMDYDFPDHDDLIGETVIDLEQRLLSSYHATCGLPKTYFTSGPCKWRDTLTPFQLLAQHCTFTGKALLLEKGKPEIINVGETPYFLSDFESEPPSNLEVGDALQRLALHVLHARGLVPEHVETRPLFSKVQPNIEQGKLEMWVDIFSEEDEEFTSSKYDPSSFGADHADSSQLALHPRQERQEKERVEKYSTDVGLVLKDPVTIAPRQTSKYELRVVIWNTTDVFLQDQSILGEKMSDIFVKAWIDGMIEKEQNTSVHERSLDGNGSFNYRMVFRFDYLPIDKKIVIKEKVHGMSHHFRHEHISPKLKVQIWDKDRFTRSEFIGDLELDLSHLVRPCVEPSHCGGRKDPRTHKQFVDLFIQQWIFGWWACRKGKEEITGKVQMTLEILNEEEAEQNPVGLGQSEPNQYPRLDKPIRPAHSFLWYLSPLKTFRWIVWRNFKGTIIKWLIIILLILIIFLFIYSIPNYAAKKALGV